MAIMWLLSDFWPDFETIFKTLGRIVGKPSVKGRIAE